MDRVAWRCDTQFLDLVLEVKLLALQLSEHLIARRRMKGCRLDFPFERLMTTLKFCKMILQRHPQTPYVLPTEEV